MPKRRAVFFDRDGVLNEERGYVTRPSHLVLYSRVVPLLQQLNASHVLAIVVTNQAAVARGLCTLEDVNVIHRSLEAHLDQRGVRVDAFYVCPHHPTEGARPIACSCRKPEPGLLLQAANDFGLDLSRSLMIGDTAADIEAGQRAGCLTTLVLTGHGWRERTALTSPPTVVVRDVFAAVEWFFTEVLSCSPRS